MNKKNAQSFMKKQFHSVYLSLAAFPFDKKAQNITQITSFVLLVFLLCFVLLTNSGCNEERLYPTPLPIEVKLSTLGYANINGRIGAGDFEKDTLLLIAGLPEDGNWDYRLDLGGYIEEGSFEVINSQAKIANFMRLEWWLELNKESTDSVEVILDIISNELGYDKGTFTCKFKKEMYEIRTWQDLQAMHYDLAGDYSLQNDILFPEPVKEGFPEQGFIPVGKSNGINNSFSGKLMGNGYSLKGFFINRDYLNYVGLFGVLSYTSEVKNLKIELSEIGVKGYNYVGALAGYANKNTIIEDCKMVGDVFGNNYVGGLVGYIGDNSKMSLSRVTGKVSGADYTGGLIGYSSTGSNIDYCFTNVTVIGTNNVGGLIGGGKGTVSNCQADSVNITGERFVGGLLGWNSGILKNCSVAAGSIQADSATGGLAGYSGNTAGIYKSCSKANVSGKILTGGFIGLNMGEIVNCYSTGGNISGNIVVGGLVGESHNVVRNCYSSSTVTQSNAIVGGFIGDKKGSATNCYWNGDTNLSLESVGNGDSFGIEKKTTSQFTNFDPSVGGVREIFLGWDFAEIWIILNIKNNGFPYLLIERSLSLDF